MVVFLSKLGNPRLEIVKFYPEHSSMHIKIFTDNYPNKYFYLYINRIRVKENGVNIDKYTKGGYQFVFSNGHSSSHKLDELNKMDLYLLNRLYTYIEDNQDIMSNGQVSYEDQKEIPREIVYSIEAFCYHGTHLLDGRYCLEITNKRLHPIDRGYSRTFRYFFITIVFHSQYNYMINVFYDRKVYFVIEYNTNYKHFNVDSNYYPVTTIVNDWFEHVRNWSDELLQVYGNCRMNKTYIHYINMILAAAYHYSYYKFRTPVQLEE